MYTAVENNREQRNQEKYICNIFTFNFDFEVLNSLVRSFAVEKHSH